MSNTVSSSAPTDIFTCDDPACSPGFPCLDCMDRWDVANGRTPPNGGAINLGSRHRDPSTPTARQGTGTGHSQNTTTHARWRKIEDVWCVYTAHGDTGDTVTVHKANGDRADVKLGVQVAPDIFRPHADTDKTAARWVNRDGQWLILVTGSAGDDVTVTNRAGKTADVTLTTEVDTDIWEFTRTDAPVVTDGLDLNPLFDGLNTQAGDARTSIWVAVPGGDTRLKLRIDRPRDGQHEGRIFVKDAAVYGTGHRYGTQNVGGRYNGDVIEALEAILADRDGAMEAYGRLVGRCAACHRPLEDPVSVARGLGPWCASQL